MAEDLKKIEISALQFDNITTKDGEGNDVPVNFIIKGTGGELTGNYVSASGSQSLTFCSADKLESIENDLFYLII